MLEQKVLLKRTIHALREPPVPCLSPRHTCELQMGPFITLTLETLALEARGAFLPREPRERFPGWSLGRECVFRSFISYLDFVKLEKEIKQITGNGPV